MSLVRHFKFSCGFKQFIPPEKLVYNERKKAFQDPITHQLFEAFVKGLHQRTSSVTMFVIGRHHSESRQFTFSPIPKIHPTFKKAAHESKRLRYTHGAEFGVFGLVGTVALEDSKIVKIGGARLKQALGVFETTLSESDELFSQKKESFILGYMSIDWLFGAYVFAQKTDGTLFNPECQSPIARLKQVRDVLRSEKKNGEFLIFRRLHSNPAAPFF